MISAAELNDIATEAKNRLDEEYARVELENLDVALRRSAECGEHSTYVQYLSQNAISRLRQLGYKVEYDDDYYISWSK
jgi:sensor c-di-GMP phosphodiesterase-like protein